jgi:hypothetical protein
VAFVQDGAVMAEPIHDRDLPTMPGVESSSAVIVDLPGAEAVTAGLSLAKRGFRPVPLFNGTSGPSPVIDVGPTIRALRAGTELLKASAVSPEAPPAFLLDSRRNASPTESPPGSYDNRWVVLPQDFPSGALLASRGIRSATLIQRGGLTIAGDLAHVLRRWQDGGIHVRVIDLAAGHTPTDVSVPKPSGFKLAWYAAVALLGLRRSNVGGFGSAVPEHASRSGFYG